MLNTFTTTSVSFCLKMYILVDLIHYNAKLFIKIIKFFYNSSKFYVEIIPGERLDSCF